MKKVRKILLTIVLLLVLAGGLLFIRWNVQQPTEGYKYSDCDAVYFTMGHSPIFSEGDFKTYRGLDTIKEEEKPESFGQINQLLEKILTENPDVNTIYMELNPGTLWEKDGGNLSRWQNSMEETLLNCIKQNPKTTFEILLPYPRITYWTGLETSKCEEHLQAYQSFTDCLTGLENVLVFYVGAEQWLNENLSNYEDAFRLNAEVEKHIFLSAFCDRNYLTDADCMTQKLETLRQQIKDYPEKISDYPDFSEWKFVFFGDSIIGIDQSTRSIPGVVGALSGATVYNCGKSGASAAKSDSEIPSFLDILDYFIDGKQNVIIDAELKESMDLFLTSEQQQNKLCFFLNFGLNDYFQGCVPDNPEDIYDPEVYAGALRQGIAVLKENYPQAEIVVLVPTYIRAYEEGMEVQGEEGRILTVYREVAVKVAEELNVHYKDNFAELAIDGSNHKEYLSDDIHLNEKGRFLFGEQLVYFLEDKLIN